MLRDTKPPVLTLWEGQLINKRSNLRDVARSAGVSVATVSRVMNTPALVSQTTRDRVEAAMDLLNFVPSASARATSTGRTRMIGALIPTLDNAIFARVLDLMEQTLAQAGLSLVVSATTGDPLREVEKAKALVNIGVEGLVVVGVSHHPDFERLIDRARMPVVAISCFDTAFPLPTIGYDNAGCAARMMQHLTELGHRDIAVIHGPVQANDRTQARIEGVHAVKGDSRLRLVESEISVSAAGAAASQVLAAAPTAILCLSDILAAGTLFECERQGVVVPRDMSVVGMDDLPMSSSLNPGLTTMHLPVGEMGRSAAQAIAAWVEEGIQPTATELEGRLQLRASSGPPRA